MSILYNYECLIYIVYYLIILSCRSHRDVAGEREAHTKEIERLQQQLKELENKLTTASKDKMNKETELKAVSEDLRRNRYV